MGNLDRYGERLDDETDDQPELHDPRCDGGWLGETPDGRPIACLNCRPHVPRMKGVRC